MKKIFLSLLICALFANPAQAAMSDYDFVVLAGSGTLQEIQEAIRNGANVNAKVVRWDFFEQTPLISAALRNPNLEVIAALVNAGADINAKSDGWTALMLALSQQHQRDLEVIIALIEAGADVNVSDGFNPPLRLATGHSNEAITLLLKAGADINVGDALGVAAMLSPDPEMIMTLVKAGADVNARTECGSTPLMSAAHSNASEVVLTLLNHGADPTIRNDDGRMAIDFARENDALRNTDALRRLAEASGI